MNLPFNVTRVNALSKKWLNSTKKFIKLVAEGPDAQHLQAEKLGLRFLHDRLVGMGFPDEAINAVAAYLKRYHDGKFMIWNLAEKTYDYTTVDDNVIEFSFPGYPSPPLDLLFEICASIDGWLNADTDNIAIVHCQTGRGRTAAVAACYLAYKGLSGRSPWDGMRRVAEVMNASVEQLLIPTQTRYLNYASKMLLEGAHPSCRSLSLDRIILGAIPDMDGQGRCRPQLQIFQNAKLLYSSTQTDKLRWYSHEDQNIAFHVRDLRLKGDVLVRVRHVTDDGKRHSMLRFGVHIGFLQPGNERFQRSQLDGAWNSARFPVDFFLDLVLNAVEGEEKESEEEAANVRYWDKLVHAKTPRSAAAQPPPPQDDDAFLDELIPHTVDTAQLESLVADTAHDASFDDLEQYVQELAGMPDEHEHDDDDPTLHMLTQLSHELQLEDGDGSSNDQALLADLDQFMDDGPTSPP